MAQKAEVTVSLLDASYRPEGIRGVEIRRPGGGVGQLDIPTVVDWLVQQAILQVLDPLLDPTSSERATASGPGVASTRRC